MPRILLIEDEADARISLANILRKRGFEVMEAEDGKKGVDILTAESFDVIISDLRTPTIDTITLLDQIGKLAKGAGVIITTAHMTRLTLSKSERINVTAYLEKPFKIEDLLALIKNILGDRPQGDTPRA